MQHSGRTRARGSQGGGPIAAHGHSKCSRAQQNMQQLAAARRARGADRGPRGATKHAASGSARRAGGGDGRPRRDKTCSIWPSHPVPDGSTTQTRPSLTSLFGWEAVTLGDVAACDTTSCKRCTRTVAQYTPARVSSRNPLPLPESLHGCPVAPRTHPTHPRCRLLPFPTTRARKPREQHPPPPFTVNPSHQGSKAAEAPVHPLRTHHVRPRHGAHGGALRRGRLAGMHQRVPRQAPHRRAAERPPLPVRRHPRDRGHRWHPVVLHPVAAALLAGACACAPPAHATAYT